MQQEIDGALEQFQKEAEQQRSGVLPWPMPVQAHTLKRGMKLYSLSVMAELIFTGNEPGFDRARTGVEELEITEYVVDTVHHPEEFPNVVMVGVTSCSRPILIIKQNGYIPGFYEDQRTLEIYKGWTRLPKKDAKEVDRTEAYSVRHISMTDPVEPKLVDDIVNYGPGTAIAADIAGVNPITKESVEKLKTFLEGAPKKIDGISKTYTSDGIGLTFNIHESLSPVMSAAPELFIKHEGAYLGERVVTRQDGFMHSTAALEAGNQFNIFDLFEPGPEGSVEIQSIDIPVLWVLNGTEVQRVEVLPEQFAFALPLDPKAPHNKDMEYGAIKVREGENIHFNLNKVTGYLYCFGDSTSRVIGYELEVKCSPKT